MPGPRDDRQLVDLLRRIAEATEQEAEQSTGLAPTSPNARGAAPSAALDAISRPVRVGGIASQALGQAGLANVRAGFSRGGALGAAAGVAAGAASRIGGAINRSGFDQLTTSNEFAYNLIDAVTPKFVQDLTGLTADRDVEQGTKRDVLSAVTNAFNVGVKLDEDEVKGISKFARERNEGLREERERAVDILSDTTAKVQSQDRAAEMQRKSQMPAWSNTMNPDQQLRVLEEIRDELRRPGGLSDRKYGQAGGKSK